ncbi:cyclase family protein [Sedimentibacter sp. zth1]|uniref:cyclase family protein n=1 Tax=Sedimentibacter sp. zth1 TaxID=2816908 RepID=UPI00352FF291
MKIIDLSYKISNNMPTFPGDDLVEIKENKTLERDYYNAISLKTNMHVGTHVDIARHLLADDRTIDEIPIDKFIGKGVLLDVRGEQIISFKKDYEKLIKENDIVLLYTGYADLYTETSKYYENYPVLEDKFADFLVYKNIKMIGIDTPSPDKEPFNIHKKLLNNDIFIIENLTNLENLININSFMVYAVPLKITAEASIVRAFAISDL